jgi:hypothetical protein
MSGLHEPYNSGAPLLDSIDFSRRTPTVRNSGLIESLRNLTREDTMGWFDGLFGRTAGPANRLFARFKRKSRAPTDPDLLKIAKERKGHISRKAVRDEYNRLIVEKYAHDKA